mgnify:CR=1 FL=1
MKHGVPAVAMWPTFSRPPLKYCRTAPSIPAIWLEHLHEGVALPAEGPHCWDDLTEKSRCLKAAGTGDTKTVEFNNGWCRFANVGAPDVARSPRSLRANHTFLVAAVHVVP